MFNSILPNIIDNHSVIWNTPKFMTMKKGNEEIVYELQKGAKNYLYKQLDIAESTSKQVDKKSNRLWLDLINTCLEKTKEKEPQFYLEKPTLLYLGTEQGNLIDIIDTLTEDSFKAFQEKYETFKIDLTTMTKTKKYYVEGKGDIVKLIFYSASLDVVKEPFVPSFVIEFDTTKSKYSVFTGIFIYDLFIFIPNISAYNTFNSYAELVISLDLDNVLNYATEQAEELYKDFQEFKDNPLEISVRELIQILHKVDYKLQLKDDNDLGEIENLQDVESNEQIQNFFNTFKFTTGETAVDIVNLNELRKIFRYNKLTILDVLIILAREYSKYEGSKITADFLSEIVYTLYDKKIDKNQIDMLRKDVQNIDGE